MSRLRRPFSTLLWGRIAAKAVYGMLGVCSGTFAASIPRIKDALGLSPALLGTALLCCSVGGFVAMQFTSPLIRRLGLRRLLAILMPVFPLVLILIALATSFWTLALVFALFGGLTSIAGIVVNAQAVDIEKAYARSIMSSFHALFSVGGLLGAGIGGLLASLHQNLLTSVAGVAVVLSGIGLLLMSKLYDGAPYDATADHTVVTPMHHHHRARWWRRVLLLGGLIFVCYLTEGAMSDWMAIYMKTAHHAGPFLAVFAYMLFTACMTIGRFSGDTVIGRLGQVQTLTSGGMLAFVGLLVGLLAPVVFASLLGFAAVGLGLAALVPILISMAGNLPGGDRTLAIARVSTCGSIGLMTGPALIGFIANQGSLLGALMVPVGLLAVLVLISLGMRRKGAPVRRMATDILE